MMVMTTKLGELWMEEYVVEEEVEEEEGDATGELLLISELRCLGLRSSSVVASWWKWRFL